jgi:hypothetical protein
VSVQLKGINTAIGLVAASLLATSVAAQQGTNGQAGAAMTADLDRTVLPIPEPRRQAITELDVRKAVAPPRFEVKAPHGAPNVVLVLIDDMGFGQPSTFGGGVSMATLDRLATGGLRYNNFHTSALC